MIQNNYPVSTVDYSRLLIMIVLKAITTDKLQKKEIIEICKLKNSYWNYGIKSNLNWFRKNVKKRDIHNLFYYQNKFIGYTLLGRRLSILNKKKIEYLRFDTFIIKKKYRKLELSQILMNFNNTIIINLKQSAFLDCKNELIPYYKKFKWIKLNDKNFKIMDHKFPSKGMTFLHSSKLKQYKDHKGMTFNQSLELKKYKYQYYFYKSFI